MAVLKHLSSKNADYGKALEYLMFQHNERTQQPILDANGNMMLRDVNSLPSRSIAYSSLYCSGARVESF